MLIQFRVENHRSLRDEQVLSMVAADGLDPGDKRLIRREGLDVALLPAVALYGANASGKSNVLGALGFMRDAVIRSHRVWEPEGGTPQEPFALSDKVNEPSLYEVDILVEGLRYRYGFVLSVRGVEEEWLYSWEGERRDLWFEREQQKYEFGDLLGGKNETIREITRTNSLFLSAAAQNNHAGLLPIFRWFRNARLDLRRGPTGPMTTTEVNLLRSAFHYQLSLWPEDNETRERYRNALIRLLQASDVGIIDITLRPLPSTADDATRAVKPPPQILFRHKTDDASRAWLPLESESAGTITLLRIIAHLVTVLSLGGLLCLDELEASLHPMLALELVRLFNDPEQNPNGCQLIFTTHDTNLLGELVSEPPLRRDQIWFTEKDNSGATHLYPLTDFHARGEENLERGYLQGRYGAIPFLGRLSPLLKDPKEG